MRTPLRLSLLSVAALGAALPAQAPVADAAWKEHRQLKVLYAGSPGGSREAAFEEFLGQWFDEVDTISIADLKSSTAAEWDVVIADWVSQYGNDGYPKREGSLFSAPCSLPADFTKPVVAMTYVGTNIRRGYKLDWL